METKNRKVWIFHDNELFIIFAFDSNDLSSTEQILNSPKRDVPVLGADIIAQTFAGNNPDKILYDANKDTSGQIWVLLKYLSEMFQKQLFHSNYKLFINNWLNSD